MEKKIFFAFSFLTLVIIFLLGIFAFFESNFKSDFLEAQISRFLIK